MSAIAGILHKNKQPIAQEKEQTLMDSFARFPADKIDHWRNEHIFFSCHAQWITPESVGEKLPFYDKQLQLAITADAMIDNRAELFVSLQIDSAKRKSITDSELILLAYQKWQEATPTYLQGDFAFVIWDERNETLFAARDFSGARTLYYYDDIKQFLFSTTIEALFRVTEMKKNINKTWLAQFLAIPTIVEAVDMNTTVYQSIKQVPPSHSITVKDGKIQLQRYHVLHEKKIKLTSNEEYEAAFRDVLEKAVQVRLRSRGKIGAHLSGGLDSSSVAYFAANLLINKNKVLYTYSSVPLSYTDWTPSYYVGNETPYIKETVQKIGNIIPSFESFPEKSPLDEIDDFLEIMEMPYKFFENTYWLKGLNEKASRTGVKVMLNGARGNHSISWGSMTLTFDYYIELLKKLKWRRLFSELDAYCSHFQTGKSVMLPFLVKRAFRPRNNVHNDTMLSLIHPQVAKQTNVYERLQDETKFVSGKSIKDLTAYRHEYYHKLYVWNKSGVASTNLSLRYALWDRDPTNDINVIQFCLSIPKEQYVIAGRNRSLIRRAMEGYLPDRIILNQERRGLQSADVIQRMKKDWHFFLQEIHELCQDPLATEWMDKTVIEYALKEVGTKPKSDVMLTIHFKLLTRALIVYRFLKKVSA